MAPHAFPFHTTSLISWQHLLLLQQTLPPYDTSSFDMPHPPFSCNQPEIVRVLAFHVLGKDIACKRPKYEGAKNKKRKKETLVQD